VSAVDAPTASPIELKEQLEAQRNGIPFLVYRDGEGAQRIVRLAVASRRLTVGRRDTNDVALSWDRHVSRVHAGLERVGQDWTLVDEGLSRNGSYVNGARVIGRRRLSDGDIVCIGETLLVYRAPLESTDPTLVFVSAPSPPALSAMQRRVLVALCRPCRDASIREAPATNQQVADELIVSVGAVKAHLRALFAKFKVGDLPHNQKRLKLVAEAFRTGALSHDDL
jgi:pSer/pThr/pTyr-binding forkhead associated (FHA) protein